MILEFRENEDSKETVTFSSTVIKLCEALHFFNIERSDVEKKIVQNFHVEKKNSCRQFALKKKIHPLKNFYPPPLPLVISNGPPLIFIDCKICYHCVLKLGYITQKKGEFDNTLSICFRIEMVEM